VDQQIRRFWLLNTSFPPKVEIILQVEFLLAKILEESLTLFAGVFYFILICFLEVDFAACRSLALRTSSSNAVCLHLIWVNLFSLRG